MNRKFDGISTEEKEDLKAKCNDLSIVIYDVRVKENDSWEDVEWIELPSANVPDFYLYDVNIANYNENFRSLS